VYRFLLGIRKMFTELAICFGVVVALVGLLALNAVMLIGKNEANSY
jgi:hypothetical protein